MVYIVSITSQGQISIPAKIRRRLGLNEAKKATVTVMDNKIIVEPVKDLLDLKGSLRTKVKASPRQIRVAFEQYQADEAVKGLE